MLGNAVLPRDKLLGIAEEAGKAAEQCEPDSKCAFKKYWLSNEERFAPVKSQYQRMLLGVPEDRASEWRYKMGIDELSQPLAAAEDGE
jgi:hypothetical protein